ncbi:MAG TPA: zinc ABC transporter ATP-binding protein AztA, partial [Acidimicrobiales bacterium]
MSTSTTATVALPIPVPFAARAHHLGLGYGARAVLTDVDLTIPTGAVTVLIGPNGAGKSTLLHALAGLVRPQDGELDVPALRRRGGVALVLQATEANQRLPLTVREVVAMGRFPHRRWFGRPTAADRAAVDAALDLLHLRDLAGAQIRELSGGQRQRAFVAQGLAQQAELLVLDEPFTGLDILSHAAIREAIAHERDAGRAVVLSTHDLADAATADQVVLLAGRVVAAGPPDEVLEDRHLSAAYGSRLVHLGGRVALLDDPHDHGCDDQTHDHRSHGHEHGRDHEHDDHEHPTDHHL